MEKYNIKVIDKAFDILEGLSSKGESSCSELARELNLPVSTTHRILLTIEAKGYITRTEAGKYTLGHRLLYLKQSLLDERALVEVAKPLMDLMVKETRESSNLGVLDGNEVLHICRVESPEALRANIPFFHLNAHTSATGKVLLAYLPEEKLDKLLPVELPAQTPKSIVSREELKVHLRLTRERGYSLDDEEGFENVRSIAVPIFRASGVVIAALSITGPTSRIDNEIIKKHVITLNRYSKLISLKL